MPSYLLSFFSYAYLKGHEKTTAQGGHTRIIKNCMFARP
jgi:hypothetical protein